MTREGLRKSWWLLAVALTVVGLGWWSLLRALDETGIGLGGSVVVLAVGYVLFVAGISLWISLSDKEKESNKKEEQNEDRKKLVSKV